MSSISTLAQQQDREAVFRRVDIRVLAFLALCYAFAYIDRVNIGFAKLQMQHDLGLSEAAYGLGAGIFFLGYVLFEVPSNLLLIKIGARKTLSRILFLWGLTSAAMYLVSNTTSFYLLRFLLGVFEAGFAPGMIFYLTYWYPRERMARALALLLCAAPIGGVISGPLSGWMLSALSGVGGLSGWQWMFICEGIPAAVLGLLALVALADTPDEARWLTADEKADLRAMVSPASTTPHANRTLSVVLRDPLTYRLAAAYFCFICGLYAIGFWLPTILKTIGLKGYVQIGLFSAIPYGFAAASMYLAGRSSDQRRERRLHAGIAGLIGAVALAIAAFRLSEFSTAMIAITVATAGMYVAYSVFWAMPSDILSGRAAAGGIAVINTIGLFGGFLSPTMIGWANTVTHNAQAGLLVIVGLVVVGSLLLLTMPAAGSRELGRT
ncbi:MFS transporter [Trinickia fusca]|uniref:MFS transporter n=1 Tax=Trinickia fusca TaxID=2419777 RepID=A0A494XA44_9BURK|nr:MFS transporter [Trinickia fusca]RKP47408.1 MFS transporter [Trinickia fusca]